MFHTFCCLGIPFSALCSAINADRYKMGRVPKFYRPFPTFQISGTDIAFFRISLDSLEQIPHQGVGLDDLQGTFQLQHSMILTPACPSYLNCPLDASTNTAHEHFFFTARLVKHKTNPADLSKSHDLERDQFLGKKHPSRPGVSIPLPRGSPPGSSRSRLSDSPCVKQHRLFGEGLSLQAEHPAPGRPRRRSRSTEARLWSTRAWRGDSALRRIPPRPGYSQVGGEAAEVGGHAGEAQVRAVHPEQHPVGLTVAGGRATPLAPRRRASAAQSRRQRRRAEETEEQQRAGGRGGVHGAGAGRGRAAGTAARLPEKRRQLRSFPFGRRSSGRSEAPATSPRPPLGLPQAPELTGGRLLARRSCGHRWGDGDAGCCCWRAALCGGISAYTPFLKSRSLNRARPAPASARGGCVWPSRNAREGEGAGLAHRSEREWRARERQARAPWRQNGRRLSSARWSNCRDRRGRPAPSARAVRSPRPPRAWRRDGWPAAVFPGSDAVPACLVRGCLAGAASPSADSTSVSLARPRVDAFGEPENAGEAPQGPSGFCREIGMPEAPQLEGSRRLGAV